MINTKLSVVIIENGNIVSSTEAGGEPLIFDSLEEAQKNFMEIGPDSVENENYIKIISNTLSIAVKAKHPDLKDRREIYKKYKEAQSYIYHYLKEWAKIREWNKE